MLTCNQRDEINQLLTETNLTQRQIAQQVGCSKNSVNHISKARMLEKRGEQSSEAIHVRNLNQSPERCPQCGALVFMPCVACRVRNEKRVYKFL